MRTVIKADQSYLHINWREIWEYRDLLWFFVLRDFTAVYKQSILGPLWFVLQPLATTLVFTVVFGNIAKIGTDGVPPFLFYLSGMVLWNYFQNCMNSVSNVLIGQAGMLSKVYFPRLVLPLSQVISNLGQFLLNFAMFLGFWVYYRCFTDAAIQPHALIVCAPLLVLQCAAVGLGVGLWLSAATVKYRDLRFALPFLAQLWMFLTPIVYPASLVSKKWHWLIAINPMAGIVEFNRHAFLGVGNIDFSFYFTGLMVGLVMLVTGLLAFNKVQRTFVDTI